MADHSLSLNAFSLIVGIERETLRKWFLKGSALSVRFLKILGTTFGITIEQATREAGGATAERKHRIAGRKAVQTGNLVLSKQDSRARAMYESSARRRRGGRRKDMDAVRRSVETRVANGAYERALRRLQEVNGTRQAALVRGLGIRLGRNPSPSAKQIHDWANDTSDRVDLPVKTVLAFWRPNLQRRGLLRVGGRSRDEKRCDQLHDLKARWRRTKSGQLAAGFWNYAASQLETDYKKLQDWDRKHRPVCTRQLAELNTRKNSASTATSEYSPIFPST